MRIGISAAVILSLSIPCPAKDLCTFGGILSAQRDLSNLGAPFETTGVVWSAYKRTTDEWVVTLHDGTREIAFYELNEPGHPAIDPERFGLLDTVRVKGHLYEYNDKLHPGYALAETLKPGDTSTLPDITPKDLYGTENLHRMVRLRGLVRDMARDGSDPNYIHLTLSNGENTAQVLIREVDRNHCDPLRYIGAQVGVIGVCSENPDSLRLHVGRILLGSGLENITIFEPPATFGTAPELHELTHALPQRIYSSGNHQTSGRVLCTWGRNSMLLLSDDGKVVRISLQNVSSPLFGQQVRVLGLPITDFYHLNLLHATWKPSGKPPVPASAPENKSPAELLTNRLGLPQLKVQYHGKAVRMTGTIRYLPDATHPDTRMQMEIDSQLVSVDTSAQPHLLKGLEIGTRVTVSGTCVMDVDDWNVNSSLQKEGGFFLVPRTADDIVVITRPSWWTPGRLMALLGLFTAALLGVIGWNISLNRRAHLKGKELAAEQLAHVTSELKVNERTRLAVELHDALSQTLTGVSMQIDTAAGIVQDKIPAVTKCLNIASRTIDACRMELRNTLWDLRSAALDEPSMDAAIRKTLCQNLAGIDLSVRFNVPRETFSDNTAHAILKIIRELATNALRHGKATSLKIAGAVKGDKLLFSVKDNGCGFDPDLAPGIAQGHFGLQGVAERLERLNGEMTIDSALGKGTKVTVTLAIPSTEK